MKLAVVGSRNVPRSMYPEVERELDSIVREHNVDHIVSGGAKGADRFGELYAIDHDLDITIYKPDWKKYGKSAGYRRNVQIISDSDIVFAIWDGQSKGTKHSLDIAEEQGKERIIMYFDSNL